MAAKASNSFMGLLRGRSNRKEYWLSILGLLALSMVVGFVGGPLIGSIVCLPVWIFIATRRLHDFGQTGWWGLVPFAAGFLLGFIPALGVRLDPSLGGGLNIAVTLISLVLIGAIPGSKGANRFGPSPGAPPAAAAAFD